jgi:hypothetical protein
MASARVEKSGSTTPAAERVEQTERAEPDPKAAAARRSRTAKALRREILRRIEQMAAGSNPPAFDRAAIEEVGRIDRMLRAYERAQPAPPSHRRFLIGGFALTVVLIAALLFMRVGSTEISLDLRVERLSFDSARKQILTGTTGAERVALGGVARVVLPPGVSSDRLADQPQPGEILSVALTAPEGGVLSVDPIEIPRGARVAIGRADPDGTTSIAVYQATAQTGKTTPMEVQVTAPSGVTLDVANSFAGPETFDLTRPRPYVFVSALDTDTFIDVTPNEGKPLVFGDEIEVDRLSFARVMEVEGEVARRLSTVLGGTVFLESLGGKAYPLRRGEHLDLALESAAISSLSVTPEAIVLRATGRARALSVGSPGNAPDSGGNRNLMPRWLEWLTARHEIGLFWGATLYVFGLLLGILRFWGIGK